MKEQTNERANERTNKRKYKRMSRAFTFIAILNNN